MKILLFGKTGQVGWELQRSLAPLGDVIAVSTNSTDFCGDFTNLDGLSKTIRDVAPDVIVNASAHTAVDKAESEPDKARLINAAAPALLGIEAKRLNALLVHYSTDYVFDGSGGVPWGETDSINPLSIYGKTKREGEEGIATSGCKYLIFRTSWVYGARGKNFAKTMVRLGQERDKLTIIDDQIGAPTGADMLADCTALAIQKTLLNPDLHGLYHLVAGGATSWHGYACYVLEHVRKMGIELKVSQDAILPVPTSAFPTPAKRPHNSRLNTQKFKEAFGLTLAPWQTGVLRMLEEVYEKQ